MYDFQRRAQRCLMNTYRRQPVMIVKGKGTKVWDLKGKEYLDLVSGIASVNLGHSHPEVVAAIKKQAERLIHISNLYYIKPQIELAEKLVSLSFADRVFFCNSGAEAIESAIKLTRKFNRDKGRARYKIISAYNSFHGRTYGGLSATGQERFQKGFEPMLPGFVYVPFGDIDGLKEKIDEETAGVMLELVQGEGGVVQAPSGYFEEVRKLCDRNELILILDEVQTGMGRLGRLFGYELFGIEPDIMTLAKSLGNGVPIGACLARKEIADAFQPGSHASTFGGNPLCASAALATLKVMGSKGFWDRVEERASYFKSKLIDLSKNRTSVVVSVRGIGMMLGLELSCNGEELLNWIREKGILVNLTGGGKVLRFLPPLTIKKEEIERAVETIDLCLKRFEKNLLKGKKDG